MNQMKLDKYIGTKIVYAFPMKAVHAEGILNRSIDTNNADEEGNGYLVEYKDGYQSWSPKAQFEEAYRPMEDMSFSLALEALKKGYKVSRKNWNGKNMWIEMQLPTETSKMTLPYIYMKTVNDDLVPWLASQTDLLAEDWFFVE